MFNYYVRYLTRINPAYFMFIMQYKKLCYYNCKVFSIVQYFKNKWKPEFCIHRQL